MINEIREYIRNEAKKFGAKDEDNVQDYVERNNTGIDALRDDGAYFGFISPEEERAGAFHDFSLTIFPNVDDKAWVVCLGIGSSGFKNDYELASTPGVRRLFSKIISERAFCKTDFTDIETGISKDFTSQVPHLKKTLQMYTKVLPVCEIVDNPNSDAGKKIISAFLAGYAKIRNWPNNKEQRNAVENALSSVQNINDENIENEAYSLFIKRRYIVLEGPPGTGKTRLAKKIADKSEAEIFFTQFHPEVSYSDFVEGIRPNLLADNLVYKKHEGILLNAINFANTNPDKKIVLIIDEINRANLSSVLGPLFYLLEYNRNYEGPMFSLPNGEKLESFPSNFYLIGTMNSADRSLAVVDFALRRRFAWLRVNPTKIKDNNFHLDDFEKINSIFYWFADSQEINFQPGQAYFIAQDDEEMKNRIKYELPPLIKEYLAEGILSKAKEELNSYFLTRIGKSLFE